MSTVVMFSFKDPSLLQFQEGTKAPTLGSNLTNLWHIKSILSDTQMRTIMAIRSSLR